MVDIYRCSKREMFEQISRSNWGAWRGACVSRKHCIWETSLNGEIGRHLKISWRLEMWVLILWGKEMRWWGLKRLCWVGRQNQRRFIYSRWWVLQDSNSGALGSMRWNNSLEWLAALSSLESCSRLGLWKYFDHQALWKITTRYTGSGLSDRSCWFPTRSFPNSAWWVHSSSLSIRDHH